jgi:hypothetical protein
MNFRQIERAFCASNVTKASDPAIDGEKQSESELVKSESRSLMSSYSLYECRGMVTVISDSFIATILFQFLLSGNRPIPATGLFRQGQKP